MLSEELDRQDFEAWFVPIYHPRHMNRNNAGDYLFIDAEVAWTAWKARSAELLSLREQLAEKEERLCRLRTSLEIEMKGHEAAERQLAELKALPPVAVLYRTGEVLTRAECADDRTFAVCCKVETPLFTAAKPEALPRHIFSMLVNELHDVPAVGCKRELIVGVLNRHGVIADSVDN